MSGINRKLIILEANVLFLFHCGIVFVLVFGWAFPRLHFIYPIVILSTLISETIFGYCILTGIEFKLRRKLEPNLNYDYSFLTYYMYRICNVTAPRKILDFIYKVFLVFSLGIYFYYTFMLR